MSCVQERHQLSMLPEAAARLHSLRQTLQPPGQLLQELPMKLPWKLPTKPHRLQAPLGSLQLARQPLWRCA